MKDLKTTSMPINLSTGASVTTTDNYLGVLEGGYRAFRILADKVILFDKFLEDKKNAATAAEIQELGEELVLNLEEILSVDLNGIRWFSHQQLGCRAAIRKSVEFFIAQADALLKQVKEICRVFLLPSKEEDVLALFDLLKQATGSLACFLLHQFGLSDFTGANIDAGRMPIEIYAPTDSFCTKNGFELDGLINLATFVDEMAKSCNPRLSIFEKFPELCDSLSDYLGEFILDEADIDIDLIDDLLNGTISEDEFLQKVQASVEDLNV